jgi:hypothetical protein
MRVSLLGKARNLRPTRIRQTQELSRLIEGLTRRIIQRLAE